MFSQYYQSWGQLILILIILTLNGCSRKQEVVRPEPLPQDSFIQVYFNHNQSKGADYTEPYRQIKRRGDDLEQIILENIQQAQNSIDLAVQEINLPNIAKALIKRQQSGVKVRVIVENTYNQSLSQINSLDEGDVNRSQEFLALADTDGDGNLSPTEVENHDALLMLKNAGIPLIDDREDGTKGSGLMHHKFMVIDGQKVITGSANFTLSGIHGDFLEPDTRGNANHLLAIDSRELAQIFTEEFNYMWGDGEGGKKDSKFGLQKPFRSPRRVLIGDSTITVKFSPNSRRDPFNQTTNGLIQQKIDTAADNIDLALFVFSEQNIADTLQKRHRQGVKIRALIDRNFAFQYYSEALDLLGVALLNKCRYEKNNNPWTAPLKTVGTANLPRGDKLHHKFAVIDGHKVIAGSHNWSESANRTNDETLLIIENKTVSSHFVREFESLYREAILGVPMYLEQKIQQTQKQCS